MTAREGTTPGGKAPAYLTVTPFWRYAAIFWTP